MRCKYRVATRTRRLVALVERGAPLVLCGLSPNALNMLLSLDGHPVQAKRTEAQIAADQPVQKH